MNKEILEQVKLEAREKRVPIILDDALEFIQVLLSVIKPKYILEIGSAVGYSAMCFSEYLAEGGKIDTIEIETETFEKAKDNIKKVGVEDKINIINANACDILPTLEDKKYDVIFIDAAKGKYIEFLNQSMRLIKDGGVIIADNVLYKGMVMSDYNEHKHRAAVNKLRKFIDIIKTHPSLKSVVVDIGDGVSVSYKI